MNRRAWILLSYLPGTRPWHDWTLGMAFIRSVVTRLEREYGCTGFPWREVCRRDALNLAYAIRGICEVLDHEAQVKAKNAAFFAQREKAWLS